MDHREREARRRELQCTIHPLNSLKTYKYVVVCTYFGGCMVLSRHRDRTTWETQGGHIEPGKAPLDAAKRELYEESGVTDAEIIPICDYYGYDSQSHANGMVFLARVRSMGPLPGYEMRERGVFAALPGELTYPNATPRLFAEAEKRLHSGQ